jgi:hypothetical protein
MKINIWMSYVIALLFLLSVSTIMVKADPSIIITDYELTPSEFMPGDEGLLTLTITNTETQASTTETSGDVSNSITITENNGVVIEKIWINPAYDMQGNKISSTIGRRGYEDFGNIAPGTSFQVSFGIFADQNISEGYYFPNVKIDLKNDINGNYEDVTFPIKFKVSNDSVDFIPLNIPSKISMSGATDISFSLINTRENRIDNVRVIPRFSYGVGVVPEIRIINCLHAGSTEEIHFSLIPTESGIIDLSFDISYENGENEHIVKSTLTVEIVDTFDVAPIIYRFPSTIEVGKEENIRLKIYNSKTEDISSVIVTPISDVQITPSQYFIGAMDADDVYSLSFDIDTTGLKINHTYEVGFLVSFKQDGTSFESPVVMSSFSTVANNGDNTEMMAAMGLIIVVFILGGFFTFRWRKKLRMKKFASK